MTNELLIMPLVLALAYGMFHALDADHIMAVTGLYDSQGKNNSIRLCLSWAIGHGAVLLLAAMVTYVLGVAIPAEFSIYAEYLVGVLLIVIGAVMINDIRRMKLHLHFHRHDGMPQHAHWHKHSAPAGKSNNIKHNHDHRAVFVGVVHGAAGSAPLLAMLPVAQTQSAIWSLAYIGIFVGGLLGSMLAFGGVLGFVMQKLMARGDEVMRAVRAVAAGASMVMGVLIIRSLMLGVAG